MPVEKTLIHIILGPMFSGKSTELVRRAERFDSIGMKIFLINHYLDSRTENYIKTHSGKKLKATKLQKLMNVFDNKEYIEADVIGIDEAQFFPDLLEFIKIAETHKKVFIIAGLDGDYKREPMGDLLKIIPYCNTVEKLTALDMIDKNGNEASFTKRIVPGGDSILIGAEEKYKAVSRENYLKF